MDVETARYVLDSFALLAYFEGEAGAVAVRELLDRGQRREAEVSLSVVNLGEVAYITERERGLVQAERVVAAIDQLPVEIVAVDRRQALAAAHAKARHPIAYADAFAVALAADRGATLVSGDPELRHVAGEVTILWLPQSSGDDSE